MENKIKPTSIKIPGKVFLLGEYIVLAGAPALLCATSQEVEFKSSKGGQIDFHDESPAGRIMTRISDYKKTGDLSGFGSSTADFIFACRMSGHSMNPDNLLEVYRKYSAGSGADLATQFFGGWNRFQKGVSQSVSQPKFSKQLLLFSAAHQYSRKIKTHEHLAALNSEQLESLRERLEPIVIRGFESLHLKDARVFGEIIQEFAIVLSEVGLEHPETKNDRNAFQKLAGVLGVKGCGAFMADALIVAIDSRPETLREVLDLAGERNLKFFGNLSQVSSGYQESM